MTYDLAVNRLGRVVLAVLGLAVVVAAFVYAAAPDKPVKNAGKTLHVVEPGSQSAAASAGAPSPSDVSLYLSAAKKTGDLGAADTGQSLLDSFGREPLRFDDGNIVHDPDSTVGSTTAGYAEYALTRRVTRIGAQVTWQPGALGSVDLILPSRP